MAARTPRRAGSDPRLLPCGDTAFTIEFGSTIDADLNAAVLALDAALAAAAIPGLIETVPTYRSLTVHVDPVAADPSPIARAVLDLARSDPQPPARVRAWRVPVVYGGEFGIDLEAVAAHHGMTAGEVVERHSSVEYRIAMLGFLPGYAYLAGLDPKLALSRRETPRPHTPGGTISIGGAQALIASIAAPSGWHLLGRTPVRSFRPEAEPTFLFEPGDRVRFEPIPAAEWEELARAAEAGETIAERVDP